MPCFHPLSAYQSRWVRANGKRGIYFPNSVQNPSNFDPIQLPCGQCSGCRVERSRQWAIRCVHEAQLHKRNCFITLTFNDDHLPEDRSLNVRDFQLFMKRLRKKYGSNIRFFHCGEYGDLRHRPHYHACLFNHDFDDRTLWKINNGVRLYRSAELESLWPYGFSSVGDVTFESAAYVARYIMKKINGDAAEDHYWYMDPETGEMFRQKPEYTTMSRRPGLATGWLEKFMPDVYPHDEIVIRGKKMRPPRFYDSKYQLMYPDEFLELKAKRMAKALENLDDNTQERLNVKEKVFNVKISRLKRTLK